MCVVAEFCLPVPYIAHAHTPALQIHTGAYTVIICDEGYLFDDGQQHREIQCQDSGVWALQDENTCTGRSTDVTQPHIEWHLITCRYKAMYHLHLYEQYKLLLYFTLSALLSDHLIVRIILFYTVSNCAAIQVPLHSIINTTVAVHSTVVHIQCYAGYKFLDNSLSIITRSVKSTGL